MSKEESLALGGPLPPPSWRTQVGNALYEGCKWPADQVNYYLDQLLAEHAHELAEKIRTSKVANPVGEAEEHVNYVLDDLADLIDPEKEGQ